jgi:hypothetical protein|tara:strand:+ start:1475 stop:1810 length:336 start_codon:yes stop_codon:yes gene_type:complete
MDDFDFTIKSGSGKYSNLDKEYGNFLKTITQKLDGEKLYRWESYNLIIEELIKENKLSTFEEVKYRLTDGEDPNNVMLDIITRENNSNGLMWLMKKRIEEYKNEDFFDQFY